MIHSYCGFISLHNMSEINSENGKFSNPNVFNALANGIRIGISLFSRWGFAPDPIGGAQSGPQTL